MLYLDPPLIASPQPPVEPGAVAGCLGSSRVKDGDAVGIRRLGPAGQPAGAGRFDRVEALRRGGERADRHSAGEPVSAMIASLAASRRRGLQPSARCVAEQPAGPLGTPPGAASGAWAAVAPRPATPGAR